MLKRIGPRMEALRRKHKQLKISNWNIIPPQSVDKK